MFVNNLRRSAMLALGLAIFAQSAPAAVWTWNSAASGQPVDGSGTWTLTGSNWWNTTTNTTWVNGSTNTAQFGVGAVAASAFTVGLGGGSLSTGGIIFQNQAYTIGDAAGGTLTLASPMVTVNSAAGGTITSTLTAANGLTLAGSGTLTLTGPLSYTGTTAVGTGTLEFNGSSGTIGSLAIGNAAGSAGSVYFHSGSITTFSSASQGANFWMANASSGGTASYFQDGGSFSVTGSNVLDIGQVNSASNSSSFTLGGGTFSVATLIGPSTIGVSSAATYSQSGGLFSFNPQNTSTATSKLLQFSANATAPTTVNITGGTFQVASNATLCLGVRTTAPMTITGNNTLVSAGTLAFNRTDATTAATGAGSVNLNGGVLQVGCVLAGVSSGGTLNLNGGTLQAATTALPLWIPSTSKNTLTIDSGGAFIDTNGQNVTIAQALVDGTGGTADSLTKINSGILTLTGANNYQGTTTVSGGTLQIGTGCQLYTNGLISVGPNATLAFSGSDTPTQGSTFSSSGISGAGGLAQVGTGGLLTLNATNTYSGPTTVTAGTLAINGALTQTSAISVGAAGTLAGSGLVGGNTSLTTLSGNGTINLSGGTIAGPLNVTGGNWTGIGAVNGLLTSSSNILAVASGGSLNTAGNMNLTGGTLTGQGTISGGTLTLGSGAAIAPGATANSNNIGTLTLPSLAMGGGSTLSYDFSNSTTPGGGVNDLIQVAGNLSLGGTTTLALNPSGGSYASGSPYTLLTYSGNLNHAGAAFALAPGSIGGRQNASYNFGSGNDSAITVTITGYNANLTWVGTNSQTWVDNPNVKPWTSPTSPAGDYFTKGDFVTFNDTAGTSVTVTVSGTVSPGSLTVSNTNTNYTFGGAGSIAGNTSLVMNGPGR